MRALSAGFPAPVPPITSTKPCTLITEESSPLPMTTDTSLHSTADRSGGSLASAEAGTKYTTVGLVWAAYTPWNGRFVASSLQPRTQPLDTFASLKLSLLSASSSPCFNLLALTPTSIALGSMDPMLLLFMTLLSVPDLVTVPVFDLSILTVPEATKKRPRSVSDVPAMGPYIALALS
eukprot:CAMPEP_0197545870 /NCGR_PEP_ID=MMETSP1320-20131121/739_1 /TAXON_ID=91990 /ORGANISM="Bolidomonas sp., Strain RCC2347" /LENGTH=177 /DNA_ID=CAMNT_0043105411 /DNA_START=69 /DNA_END=602 /DNA_ORIENTATION=-